MQPLSPVASCSQQAAWEVARRQQIGPFARAPSERARTARMKRAARRYRGQARHSAVDLRKPLGFVAERRDRTHQSDRVRVLRAMDDVCHRTDLDDATRVHDSDAVCGLRDDAHVVRDEHHRGAMFAA
jgi:hypothetical protein